MPVNMLLSVGLAVLLLATPASAKTYVCKFTGNAVGKTVSEVVVVTHDESSGQVTVQDGFTNNYVGGPMSGKMKSMNATRVLFGWELPSLKDGNGNWVPGIAFSLNLIRATGEASISGKPQGNYKSGRASGACSIK